MKTLILTVALLFLPLTNAGVAHESASSEAVQRAYRPKKGYVPDEQTAIRIAEAVWIPIYGAQHIEKEKPFKATLKNGAWTVPGTLAEGVKGGTVMAIISSNSGCILGVGHKK